MTTKSKDDTFGIELSDYSRSSSSSWVQDRDDNVKKEREK